MTSRMRARVDRLQAQLEADERAEKAERKAKKKKRILKPIEGKNQKEIILSRLLKVGILTTLDAREMGIIGVTGCIFNLKKEGWPIKKVWFHQEDHTGTVHRVAQYYLNQKKLKPEQLKTQHAAKQS